MHRYLRASIPALAVALCSFAFAGCSPQDQARQSLEAGDPVRAAQLYEKALQRRPRDPDLLAELSSARSAAGRQQARRAEAALAAGEERRALAFARGAAAYDPQYRAVEVEIRRRIAERRLNAAEAALASEDFASARAAADHAREISHDLPEAADLQRRIDLAEARALATLAQSLAESGDERRARQLAQRAAELSGDEPELSAVTSDVERTLRRQDFQRMMAAAKAQLQTGQLLRVEQAISELSEIDPDDADLAELRAAYEQRRAEFDTAVADARRHRAAGEHQEALREYARAMRMVRDHGELEAEREAASLDLKIASLTRSATLSMEGGRYEQAAETLLRALDLRPDEQTEALLRQALAADHRQALYHAMESEETLEAIDQLEQLVQIQPDETAATILRQLQVRVADEALVKAGQLATDGELDKAIEAVAAAMQHSPDDRLLEWRTALETDRLVERAVEAEKVGDFVTARSFYLDALATGRRPDVSDRVAEIESKEEVQAELERSRVESRRRDAELRRRDEMITELQREVEEREQALRDARARVSELEANARRHRTEVERLHARIDRLEAEIEELLKEGVAEEGGNEGMRE